MRTLFLILLALNLNAASLVLQSDFGLKDSAVAAMKGVAVAVDENIKIHDITHAIEPYDIWEGAYSLHKTASYWPKGTVFVSVVDPGVGTERPSIVLKTKSGHYFVSPDNGTLTLVAQHLGIDEVRRIDESKNRLSGSQKSYTFHGRDVYAYTGALLASGKIKYKDVGPKLESKVYEIAYQKARLEANTLIGNLPILDHHYGNVWSNIPDELFEQLGGKKGDSFCAQISEKNETKWQGALPYVNSFGDVAEGEPLLYLNSLLNVSLALNMRNFSAENKVAAGADWSLKLWLPSEGKCAF